MPGRVRGWAHQLFAAWLDGQPAADILDKIPAEDRENAAYMARCSCQIIHDRVRSVRVDGRDIERLPKIVQKHVARRIATLDRKKQK